MLIRLEHIYKYFGGEALLRDVTMTVEDRETVGLVGPNGCGKSTLLGIIMGEVEFDKTPDGLGSVETGSNVTVGFLRQNSGLDSRNTIDAELHRAFEKLLSARARMDELEEKMTGLAGAELEIVSEEYSELAAFFEANDGYRIDVRIDQVMNGMGFGGVPRDRLVSSLSGGERTRLALAKLLLEAPDLLILDEPTNHLDLATLMWLEEHLRGYKGSVLIVSHDRYFLNRVCTRICGIENGRLTSYKGDYSAYLVQKKMNDERHQKEYEAQQEEIKKLEDYIVRNKVRASTAKQAKSRQNALDRMERIERPAAMLRPPKLRLEYTIEPTKDIVKVVDCPLRVGEGEGRKTLIEHLDLHIRRGEHAAIIGQNGIGKTSILKLIQGMLPHDRGNILWGGNVKIAYFDQEHSILDPRRTAVEELTERFPSVDEAEARKLLSQVLMTGEDVFKPVSVLSGGERAKLCFAIMSCIRGNVLILDEPTNHLDLDAKEALEDVLAEFPGTIILVSHDRYLINKVADRIIEVRADGVECFEGNFDAWSKVMRERAQAAAEEDALRRREAAEEELRQKKERTYRSKEQRAATAKMRSRIKELEKLIEETEIHISELEGEIADPKVAADYELMTQKCSELEEARGSVDEMMEEWAELSEMV